MMFNLVTGKEKAAFVLEESAFSGVKKIAEKVIGDIELITDVKLTMTNNKAAVIGSRILVGTIDKSEYLKELEGKVDGLSEIRGKREVYLFKLIEDEGVPTLLIAGSDKRGTIYGLFHISDILGVSPWVYMADVLPAKRKEITFDESVNMISKEPSVKYRGFFINDEWPSYGNWTFKHYGGFTAQMYDHVFEVLLRMKGNYLWPAMWTSNFSLDGPGMANAILADEYGIVMSNSHHEPCLRHSEEWDLVRGEGSRYGNAWNFDKNKEGLINYWADALDRNGKLENIITIGMRGERDSEILGRAATLQENIDYLKEVITSQNKLIKEHVNENLDEVPRMLALYKEVEAYYYGDENAPGLKDWDGLDGVTLMLCDDNFANTRTLPVEAKKDRKGGWGMYYHFDYHGDPVSYEWVNSTHLPKVWEQMSAAYEFGIRDIWIVNVGDLKPQELPLSYFLDLAYDFDKYGTSNPNATDEYVLSFAKKCFGAVFDEADINTIAKLLNGYSALNNLRRPESLLSDTIHPVNYGEADRILKKAKAYTVQADNLLEKLEAKGFDKDDAEYSAFYQLVYYPVVASMNVWTLALTAGRNELYAKQGRLVANKLAEEMEKCQVLDRFLMDGYHSLNNGKWDQLMLSEHIGFKHWNDEECQFPIIHTILPANKPRMIVALHNQAVSSQGGDWTRKTLYALDMLSPNKRYVDIDIATGAVDKIDFEITGAPEWLNLSAASGCIRNSGSVSVRASVDDEKLAKVADAGSFAQAALRVTSDRVHVDIVVFVLALGDNERVKNYIPVLPKELLDNPAVVNNEIGVTIEAEDYSELCESGEGSFKLLKPYGKFGSAIKAFPVTKTYQPGVDAPVAVYKVYAPEDGEYEITLKCAPSNPVDERNLLRCAMSVNSGDIDTFSTVPEGFVGGDRTDPNWGKGVMDNCRSVSRCVKMSKGSNDIKVYALDPAFVLERVLVRSASTKWSEGFVGAKVSAYEEDF